MEENKDIKMTQELRQAVDWRLGSYQQPAAQGTARTERLFGHQPQEYA